MPRYGFGTTAAAVLAAVMSAACGTSRLPSAATTAGDSLRVVSIVPEQGTRFRLGQRVTFTVTVEYTLASADTGGIELLISDNSRRTYPSGSQALALVSRGTGVATLTDSVTVPTPPGNAIPVREMVVVLVLSGHPTTARPIELVIRYGVD